MKLTKIQKRKHIYHSTYNMICLQCRKAGKLLLVCSHCGQDMICLGKRWRVPKKSDDRGWAKLETLPWVQNMNTNYICFDCRKSARDIKYLNHPKCPSCSGEMVRLNYTDGLKVPKKDDTKAWQKLRKDPWIRKQLQMIMIHKEEANDTNTTNDNSGTPRVSKIVKKKRFSRRYNLRRGIQAEGLTLSGSIDAGDGKDYE